MEFVRKYPRPLSSDAFSVMGKEDQKENCLEIIDAYTHLLNSRIPIFAKKLPSGGYHHDTFVAKLHQAGINVRYIGRVYQFLTDGQWLIQFALSRVTKNILRTVLRRIPPQSFYMASKIISDFLNTLLKNVLFCFSIAIPPFLMCLQLSILRTIQASAFSKIFYSPIYCEPIPIFLKLWQKILTFHF